MTGTSAAAASRTARGLFAGLPREAAILSAVSFTVALGYGIVAPAIPPLPASSESASPPRRA